MLLIIVISSVILERIHLYYPDNEYGLVCEYMILPERDSVGINGDVFFVYFKGEIYNDRIMKCYVVARKQIDRNMFARQDVGPIEHSSEYVKVFDSNVVTLTETEYRKVINYANYLSGVANDIPFGDLGGYALGTDDICIKYKGKWYDDEFMRWDGKGAGRLKPSWVDNSFLEPLIKEKVHNDFWYDIADIFYEKSGFVYKEDRDSRPSKWKSERYDYYNAIE